MAKQIRRRRDSAFAQRCLLAALAMAVACALVAFDARLPAGALGNELRAPDQVDGRDTVLVPAVEVIR
jgi:hypothetical protein